MSKKKAISLSKYRKRKERTHSTTEDIVKEFSESMESPEVPIAHPPQGLQSSCFFPPVSKRAKRPPGHQREEIDLTTEADIATEQPIPDATCLPPRLSTASHPTSTAAVTTDTTGRMAEADHALNFVTWAKDALDSPSPCRQSNTSLNSDLSRASLKVQHQTRLSGGLNRAPIRSQQRRPSSSPPPHGRVERSFIPSMSSSLPALQSRQPTSSPSSRTSLADVKRLPSSSSKPGSLLADIYGSPKSATSISGKGRLSTGQLPASMSDSVIGKGRQSTSQVVVIDSDEGDHNDSHSSRLESKPRGGASQTQPTGALPTKEVKVVRVGVCGEDGSPVQMYERQNRVGEGPRETSGLGEETIPPLSDLKMQELKAIGDRRPTAREAGDPLHRPTARPSRSVMEYCSGGLTSGRGNGGGALGVPEHTVASSNTDMDSSADTVSSYFTKEKRRDEVALKRGDVHTSVDASLPADILTVMDTGHLDGGRREMRPATHPTFVPRCKGHLPVDDVKSSHKNYRKHHTNHFAKNQRPREMCDITSPDSSDRESGGFKLSQKCSTQTLSIIPTLSKDCFSISVSEDTSTSQASDAKCKARERERHARIVKGRRFEESSEDDDFQTSPLRRKTATETKNNKGSFYGTVHADSHFNQLLGAAAQNVLKRRGLLDKSSKQNIVKGVTKSLKVPVQKPRLKFTKPQHNLAVLDEDDMIFELLKVQIGRLICDGVYNLEIRSRELCFQFQCGDVSHRQTIELKHLTSWKMYLGEGPRFIAIEIDLGAINKLKNILITKFHLRSDFLALASSDPSQRNVIFRLADCISPEDVANISEIMNSLNGMTLNYCNTQSDMSKEDAEAFLESMTPTESAKVEVTRITKEDIAGLSLIGGESEGGASVTGQSRGSKHVVLRRSQRQRKPRYSKSVASLGDSDVECGEEPIPSRPKAPNVKLLTYKPVGSKLSMDMMSADLECLEPGEYLNDKIIDFYLNYLLYEKLSEKVRERVHVFSTFFYTRLSNASMDDKASSISTPEKLHSRVKTWTRRVDLFSKDYIILPVCDRAHWYVVIVCHPGTFDPSKVFPQQPRSRQKAAKGNSKWNLSLRSRSKVKSAGVSKGDEGDQIEDEESCLMEDDTTREENKVEMIASTTSEEGEVPEETTGGFNFDLLTVAEVSDRYSLSQGLPAAESPVHVDEESSLLETTVPETPPLFSQEGDVTEEGMELERDVGGEEVGDPPPPTSRTPSPPPAILIESSQDQTNSIDQIEGSEDFLPLDSALQTDKGDGDEAGDDGGDRDEAGDGGEGGEAGGEAGDSGEAGDGGEADKGAHDEAGDGCEAGDGGEAVKDGDGGDGVCEGDGEDSIGVDIREDPVVKEEPMAVEEEQNVPCIRILDSLGIKRPSAAKRIRNYLTMEWKLKKADREGEMSFEHLPLKYPKVPFQDNSSDCGIFVLQFVESLLETVHKGLPLPSTEEAWASYEQTRAKRKELDQLIHSLKEKHS